MIDSGDIAAAIDRHLGALNRMERHLGCAKCRGELHDGACPVCQLDQFEIGKDGKLRRISQQLSEEP